MGMCHEKNAYKVWWKSMKEGDHLEDPSVRCEDIRIYLKEMGWKVVEDVCLLRTG
jgi:uncharacterized protein YjcR